MALGPIVVKMKGFALLVRWSGLAVEALPPQARWMSLRRLGAEELLFGGGFETNVAARRRGVTSDHFQLVIEAVDACAVVSLRVDDIVVLAAVIQETNTGTGGVEVGAGNLALIVGAVGNGAESALTGIGDWCEFLAVVQVRAADPCASQRSLCWNSATPAAWPRPKA